MKTAAYAVAVAVVFVVLVVVMIVVVLVCSHWYRRYRLVLAMCLGFPSSPSNQLVVVPCGNTYAKIKQESVVGN